MLMQAKVVPVAMLALALTVSAKPPTNKSIS